MRKLVRITSANRYKIFVTSDKGWNGFQVLVDHCVFTSRTLQKEASPDWAVSQGEDDGVDDGLGDEEQVGGGVEAESQQGINISVGQYTTWCSNPYIDIECLQNNSYFSSLLMFSFHMRSKIFSISSLIVTLITSILDTFMYRLGVYPQT